MSENVPRDTAAVVILSVEVSVTLMDILLNVATAPVGRFSAASDTGPVNPP
jgi:hypothetical protein